MFFFFILTWTTEWNLQYIKGKDSDIVEELFESLCANFYPYLFVSWCCCSCYCTYLRDICILNYCVSKRNENSSKYLVLKFLFAYEEIKWPQTSAEIVLVLSCKTAWFVLEHVARGVPHGDITSPNKSNIVFDTLRGVWKVCRLP